MSHKIVDPSTGATPTATKAWRWIVLLLALSQLIVPRAANRLFEGFLSASAINEAAITPPGYAFSIWGLICVLCVLTTAAVTRLGFGAQWETRVLTEACIVFLGFSGWLVVAAQGWLWASVAVLAVMVIALIDIMRLLVNHHDELTCPRWLTWLATITFGLYLGWSSIAVFINVAAALVNEGWSANGTGWLAIILVFAAIAGLTLTVTLHATPGYVAACLWAFITASIGAAQRQSPTLAAISAIAAGLIIITVATIVVRKRHGYAILISGHPTR